MKKNPLFIYFSICAILVIAGLVLGFRAVGSPFEARVKRLDNQRVQDLSSLSYKLDDYFRLQKKLPAALQELPFLPKDPQNNELYGYEQISENRYKLCAVFSRATDDDENESVGPYHYGPYGKGDNDWSHGAGQSCFTREIQMEPPDLYPHSIRVAD